MLHVHRYAEGMDGSFDIKNHPEPCQTRSLLRLICSVSLFRLTIDAHAFNKLFHFQILPADPSVGFMLQSDLHGDKEGRASETGQPVRACVCVRGVGSRRKGK